MMKQGLTPDGVPCLVLDIPQTVTAEQLAAALAFQLMEPDTDDLVNMNRERAEEILRTALFNWGQNLDYRDDTVTGDWTQEQRELYEFFYQSCLPWVWEKYPFLNDQTGGSHADRL